VGIKNISTEALEAELARRHVLDIDQLIDKREEEARSNLDRVDSLLVIALEHQRGGCNDQKVIHTRSCTRCFLLDAKQSHFWDPNYQPNLTIDACQETIDSLEKSKKYYESKTTFSK